MLPVADLTGLGLARVELDATEPVALPPPAAFAVAGLGPVANGVVLAVPVAVDDIADAGNVLFATPLALSPLTAAVCPLSPFSAVADEAVTGFFGAGAMISSVPCTSGARRCPGVISAACGVASGLY
jgi:hypothetical protein